MGWGKSTQVIRDLAFFSLCYIFKEYDCDQSLITCIASDGRAIVQPGGAGAHNKFDVQPLVK